MWNSTGRSVISVCADYMRGAHKSIGRGRRRKGLNAAPERVRGSGFWVLGWFRFGVRGSGFEVQVRGSGSRCAFAEPRTRTNPEPRTQNPEPFSLRRRLDDGLLAAVAANHLRRQLFAEVHLGFSVVGGVALV